MEEFDKELERTINQTIETEIEQQTQSEKIVNSSIAMVIAVVMIIIGMILLKRLNKENKYSQITAWTLVGIGFSGIVINGIQLFLKIVH